MSGNSLTCVFYGHRIDRRTCSDRHVTYSDCFPHMPVTRRGWNSFSSPPQPIWPPSPLPHANKSRLVVNSTCSQNQGEPAPPIQHGAKSQSVRTSINQSTQFGQLEATSAAARVSENAEANACATLMQPNSDVVVYREQLAARRHDDFGGHVHLGKHSDPRHQVAVAAHRR